MTKKTLKFNNIRVNKKEFRMSKQPIVLMSVNIDLSDLFVVSDKCSIITKVLNILFVTKKVKLLNHYVLFYLK